MEHMEGKQEIKKEVTLSPGSGNVSSGCHCSMSHPHENGLEDQFQLEKGSCDEFSSEYSDRQNETESFYLSECPPLDLDELNDHDESYDSFNHVQELDISISVQKEELTSDYNYLATEWIEDDVGGRSYPVAVSQNHQEDRESDMFTDSLSMNKSRYFSTECSEETYRCVHINPSNASDDGCTVDECDETARRFTYQRCPNLECNVLLQRTKFKPQTQVTTNSLMKLKRNLPQISLSTELVPSTADWFYQVTPSSFQTKEENNCRKCKDPNFLDCCLENRLAASPDDVRIDDTQFLSIESDDSSWYYENETVSISSVLGMNLLLEDDKISKMNIEPHKNHSMSTKVEERRALEKKLLGIHCEVDVGELDEEAESKSLDSFRIKSSTSLSDSDYGSLDCGQDAKFYQSETESLTKTRNLTKPALSKISSGKGCSRNELCSTSELLHTISVQMNGRTCDSKQYLKVKKDSGSKIRDLITNFLKNYMHKIDPKGKNKRSKKKYVKKGKKTLWKNLYQIRKFFPFSGIEFATFPVHRQTENINRNFVEHIREGNVSTGVVNEPEDMPNHSSQPSQNWSLTHRLSDASREGQNQSEIESDQIQDLDQDGGEITPRLTSLTREGRGENNERNIDVLQGDPGAALQENANHTPPHDASHSMHRPKYPLYELHSRRLQTYHNWPQDRQQTPQQLAEAGFFYGGREDIVTCFYCGGELRQWRPGEEPWFEHAWHFGRGCYYLLIVKGDEFITQVQDQFQANQNETGSTENNNVPLSDEQVSKNTEILQNNTNFVEDTNVNRGVRNEQPSSGSSQSSSSAEVLDVNSVLSNTSSASDSDGYVLELRTSEEVCLHCHREPSVMLLPCQHLCLCQSCADIFINNSRPCRQCNESINDYLNVGYSSP